MTNEQRVLFIRIRDAAGKIARGARGAEEERLIREMEQAAAELKALSAAKKTAALSR